MGGLPPVAGQAGHDARPDDDTTDAEPDSAAAASAREPDAGQVWWRRWPPSDARVLLGSFLLFAAVLVGRNAYLFSTRIYEDGDFAANSLAINHAKHFTLLVGDYSRNNFYHPGPAFLYLQGYGEWLFHDLLHAVPTPFNGQFLMSLLSNAALLAVVVLLLHRHLRLPVVTGAVLATLLLFTAAHPLSINSPWLSYLFFAPSLLLVVGAASVATGRVDHLPAFAFALGMCVHGHVEFFLFGAGVTAVVLVVTPLTCRHDLTGLFRGHLRAWLATALILAVFALPIVLELALHWPGQFRTYLNYARQNSNTYPHTFQQALRYVLWFWAKDTGWNLPFAVALLAAAVAVVAWTHWRGDRSLAGLLAALLGVSVLMTAMMLYYAQQDIDYLDDTYVGYFYWAVPLLVLLVVIIGLVAGVWAQWPGARRVLAAGTAVVLLGGVVADSAVAQQQDNPTDPPAHYVGLPTMPRVARAITAASARRPIVIGLDHDAWPEAVAFLVYADRHGIDVCWRDYTWDYIVRPWSVCSRQQTTDGTLVWFSVPALHDQQGQQVATLPGAIITVRQPPNGDGLPMPPGM